MLCWIARLKPRSARVWVHAVWRKGCCICRFGFGYTLRHVCEVNVSWVWIWISFGCRVLLLVELMSWLCYNYRFALAGFLDAEYLRVLFGDSQSRQLVRCKV